MSVIVRGIEMPKSCALCKFRGAGETWCPFTLQEVPGNTIPEDCPLSPVPPHGPLVDALDIINTFPDEYVFTNEQARALTNYIIPAEPPKEEE